MAADHAECPDRRDAPLKNNVRVQDARFQQRIVSYQLTVLRATQEVEDALTGYLKAREEVAFREASTTASQQAAELALDSVSNRRRQLHHRCWTPSACWVAIRIS